MNTTTTNTTTLSTMLTELCGLTNQLNAIRSGWMSAYGTQDERRTAAEHAVNATKLKKRASRFTQDGDAVKLDAEYIYDLCTEALETYNSEGVGENYDAIEVVAQAMAAWRFYCAEEVEMGRATAKAKFEEKDAKQEARTKYLRSRYVNK